MIKNIILQHKKEKEFLPSKPYIFCIGKRNPGIIEASRELNCDNLMIICWNKESEEKIKNKTTKFIPLWKWLIE